MPANVVHNEHEEDAWSRAKAATKKQYPDLSEDNDRFWAITNHIYQNMKSYSDEDCYVDPGTTEKLVQRVQEEHLGKSLAEQGEALCLALHREWDRTRAKRRLTRLLGLVR